MDRATMRQSSENSHVNDLRWFYDQNIKQGLRFGYEYGRAFIPERILDDYLFNQGRLPGLLTYAMGKSPTPRELESCVDRSKILTILILCGHGSYIKQCMRDGGITDVKLPFQHRPHGFPDNVFEDFNRVQWAFCAHKFKKEPSDSHMADQMVLPIIHRHLLKTGRTSNVYEVGIYPDYCFCASDRHYDGEVQELPCNHSAVLKVYAKDDESAYRVYTNEFETFDMLNSTNEEIPNVVAYLGSFVQNGECIMMLELADKGTLEEYFEQIEPPVTTEEITNFWESMFELAKGLARIHESEHASHQDIKPSNILVFSNGNKSPYKWTFKFADFGLGHMDHENANAHAARIGIGTRTYGAPEFYQDRYIHDHTVLARPSGDVWSLMCIFSEAVSWVVEGLKGINKYQKRRTSATSLIPDFKDADCFHNGSELLPLVEDWHRRLEKMRASSDVVTRDIWSHMLCDGFRSGTRRLSASAVVVQSVALIHKQKQEGSRTRTPSPHLERAVTLPSLRYTSGHDYIYWGSDVTIRAPPAGTRRKSHQIQSSVSTISTRLSQTQTEGSRGDHGSIFTSPNSYSPSPRSSGTSHINDPNLSATENTSLDKLRDQSSFDEPDPTIASSNSLKAAPPATPEHEHQQPEINRDNLLGEVGKNFHLTHFPLAATIEQQDFILAKCLKHPEPYLSVHDLGLWYDQQKALSRKERENCKLPYHAFLTHVSQRDHIIVVDDSISMKKYWKEVTVLFRYLSYITKGLDPDGIELYFTNSRASRKSKSSSPLVEMVSNIKDFSIPSDPGRVLFRIWSARRSFGNGWGAEPSSPLSIYILTDGVWQEHTTVKEFIHRVVADLDAKRLPPKHVGIQFIQFGKGKAETEKLDRLDNDMGLCQDIVDTEFADGNVWKMLLGAVDATFDSHPRTPQDVICVCAELSDMAGYSFT